MLGQDEQRVIRVPYKDLRNGDLRYNIVVRPNDYRGAGFDRGHLCPAGDRSVSREDMDATFLMSNMVPQAPDLNRITWEKLESYCRDQVRDGDQVLYITAGPAGRGGVGSDGPRDTLRGSGAR